MTNYQLELAALSISRFLQRFVGQPITESTMIAIQTQLNDFFHKLNEEDCRVIEYDSNGVEHFVIGASARVTNGHNLQISFIRDLKSEES